MNDYEQQRIWVALGIISWRLPWEDIDNLKILGFDPRRFSFYGKPTEKWVKLAAEDIIFNYITKGE